MNQTIKWIVGVVVAVVVIVAGYSLATKSPKETGPIKIGFIGPFSGNAAAYGNNDKRGLDIAIGEINSSGGVTLPDGSKHILQIVYEDGKCDSKGGAGAANKLINFDKINYIIGGVCSNETLAAAPFANKAKALLITPSTGGPNIDTAGEWVFRVGNNDVIAGEMPAESMIQRGFKNIAILTENTDYTLSLSKALAKKFTSLGGQVVANEVYQPNATDLRTELTKIKAANPDAIYISPQTTLIAAVALKQAFGMGFRADKIYGNLTFNTTDVTDNIDTNKMEGMRIYEPVFNSNNPSYKRIVAKHLEKYGKKVFLPFHFANTLEVLFLYRDALESVGNNPQKIHDWLLENVKNRTSMIGVYSLDAEGNSNVGFTEKIFKDGKFQ